MSEQKPDPWAAIRDALTEASEQMSTAMNKALVSMHAQTALRHLLDGNEQAARRALVVMSPDGLAAVGTAAHKLTDLACDVFAEVVEQQRREGQ